MANKRTQILATNEIYHLFNRSVAKENIFASRKNLGRLSELLDFYRFPQKLRYSKFKTLPLDLKSGYISNFKKQKPLVEIYSFAAMPNHYHLLLKQLQDKGIFIFISNLQNSFAKFFNIRSKRNGSVFQNPFKAKRVETDEEFLHVSRYIHLNPVTSFLIEFKDLVSYPWTSYQYYKEGDGQKFINTERILNYFKSKNGYIKFIADQVDYQRQLEIIKHLIME